MNELLNETETICRQYRLDSLLQQIKQIRQLVYNNTIDISVFGQFKAGKSSFLNNIIGKAILPTGVIPVTSILTYIYYGLTERAYIDYKEGYSEEIHLNDIGDYVTEKQNPDNVKDVDKARIELPVMEKFKGLCLVDTPGIGSIFLNNSRTANENISFTSIAIVCISAERPLAETDLELISKLIHESYKVICLLTKVDLFTEEQTKEILAFMKKSLSQKTGHDIPVYKYSVYSNNDLYREKIQNEIFLLYLDKFDVEIENIFQHKVLKIANSCLQYMELAREASLKTDVERDFLKAKIFDEQMNMPFIRHELSLIASDAKSRVRDSVFSLIEPHVQDIIIGLQHQFDLDFQSWKGNLYNLSRSFEQWLKTSIGTRLLKIIKNEQPAFENVLKEVNSKFSFYSNTFKGRIEGKVLELLNLKISTQKWKPSFKPMKQPDISVYPAFDTPIDLIWFFFPMYIFRNIFKRYFRRQIKAEVFKNVYRTTSIISEIIFREIDLNREQTLDYCQHELQTIEHALSARNSKTEEYDITCKNLKKAINQRVSDK